VDGNYLEESAEVVTPLPAPDTGRIPAWMLEEIVKWIEGARNGDLEFHFDQGVPRFFRSHVTINPLRGDAPGGYQPVRWIQPPVCPADKAPLAEGDYGERFRCSKCARVYTYWQLTKIKDAWTPQQWDEIQRKKERPGGGR
jgi:hypothetical protein